MTFEEFLSNRELNDIPLYEGINIDIETKSVSFTDSHEDYVDTSLSNNPKNKIGVYSVFTRKESKDARVSDGNPLVYALKNINGWSISEEDKEALWGRITNILDKINKDFSVVITAPSSSSLVSLFANRVQLRYPTALIYDTCLLKRTKEEIFETMAPWSDYSDAEIQKISKAFSKMKYWFEAKHYPKELLSRLETDIVKINSDFKDGLNILNKDILIIDDVISSGFSLGSCANAINESYSPNSITNLVLFGK